MISQTSSSPKDIQFLRADDLHFDPENPRLPNSVDKKNEQEVLKWMIQNATITELMGSIAEKGYFDGEPLMVVPRAEGGYQVIEGNRRLAAIKLLRNPLLAPERKKSIAEASQEVRFPLEEIPTIFFEKRADILDNLGFRHVTGIKPWGPLAKARFLVQLNQNLNTDLPEPQRLKTLAKSIGSRTDYVAGLLTGYAVYEEIENAGFFGIRGLDQDTLEFSLLTTALGYANISHFVGLESGREMDISNLNQVALKELTQWVFERNSENRTRIGESRRLKDLNDILDPGSPQAVTAFRAGKPLQEALLFTKAPLVAFRLALMTAKSRLEDAQDYLKHSMDLQTADREDGDVLRRLASAVYREIEAQMKGDDDL